MKKKITQEFKKEFLIILFFISVFITIRSIHFIYHLTFMGWDQAEHAIAALNVVKNKKLVLLGPRISAVSYQNKQIFLGPAMTYLMVFFLVLGKWDPAIASYIFMIFSGLMIVPLYYGVKWLVGKRSAWIMVIFYTLLPYYLTYTRFLWNPNFQFALLPILFFLMGYYQKSKKQLILFLISFWLGILFQLHYQFIFSLILITTYYFLLKKEGLKKFLIFCAGFLAGVSPLILFEFRNQFYLTNTLILYAKHYKEVQRIGNKDHYYLSQSFIFLLGFLALINNYLEKIKVKVNIALLSFLSLILFSFSARNTFIRPDTEFWSYVPYWNYPAEVKVYEIIKKEDLKNFNVTNQLYDSLALIQKYMLMRDNITINFDDYYNNKYLFIIEKTGKKNYMENPGYEVLGFRPYRYLKTWKINDHFCMHLVERLNK